MKYQHLLFLSVLTLLLACKADIYTNLTEAQANEILLLLRSERIEATKRLIQTAQESSWKISVEESEICTALSLLEKSNLPRKEIPGFSRMMDNRGLVPSSIEEKALFLDSLCGELSKTLMKMEGVIEARVHISFPEKDDFYFNDKSDVVPTASVFLKVYSDFDSFISDEQIKNLVANGVQNLNADRIAVIRNVLQSEKISYGKSMDAQNDSVHKQTVFRMYVVSSTLIILLLAAMVFVLSFRIQKLKRAGNDAINSFSVNSKIGS